MDELAFNYWHISGTTEELLFFQFSNESEVLARANAVEYGLCASVWSENVGTIHRMAHGLQVNRIYNNNINKNI